MKIKNRERSINMKVKKLLLILALIIGINIAFSMSSYATTGTVTGNTVRVRESDSTDSEIVTNVYKDDKVTVLEKKGNWYKIEYDGFEGYVYSEYLKVDEEITNTNTEDEPKEDNNKTEDNDEAPVSSTSVVSIEIGDKCKLNKDAKLYIIPVLYASVIENLSSGATVTVIQIANNWIYVETDKYTGWLPKSALEETVQETSKPETTEPETRPVEQEPEEQPSTEPEEATDKVGYVNVENANVREGASVDTEHIITIKLNQEVKILGEKNGWYQVDVNGVTGYINKKLISDEKVEPTTSRSMTEARTSSNEKQEEEQKQEQVEDTSIEENTTTEEVVPETTSKGTEIVAYAKTFLGGKYVSGGNNPNTGVDCSGFTKYVFEHFGYTLSRTTSGQAKNGKEVNRSEMQEGDIIIFLNDSKSKIGHVGIYIGNDKFIHAANASRGIVIDSVYNSYYDPRFVCARRII